jgi:hypothetical protein
LLGLLASFGLNRLIVPERFGLHLLDFIDGSGILGEPTFKGLG